MAKNTNRVASLIAYVAALGLATGAWAAHWELDVEEKVTYAKEIFGGDDPGGLDLTLKSDDEDNTNGRQGTRVQVQLVLANTQDTVNTGGLQSAVGANSEAEITLTIAGAVFGEAVDWTDITTGRVGETDNVLTKVTGSRKDGRAGDSSVTVKFNNSPGALSGPSDTSPGAEIEGAVINFYIGSLEGAAGLAGAGKVTATASMTVTSGPDTDNFPTEFAARKPTLGDNPATTEATEVETDFLLRRGSSAVIADSANAMTFMPTAGVAGSINVEDRAKLQAGTQVLVGGITHTSNMMAVQEDGTTSFASGKGMDANVHVTVEGMVRDTDTVYFDRNGNMKMDAKEGMTIENGVATGSFSLVNGNAYWMPDGETAMTQGTLKGTYAVEYDATSVVDPKAVTSSAMLTYHDVMMQARAYAIPPASHADEGNVRLKCEATGDDMCTVFLECNEQDGMSHFGELGDTIAAGATEHMTGGDIADVLGIDDWMGRLSCDVLSADAVSVQVLVRSGDSLINNTYVDHP